MEKNSKEIYLKLNGKLDLQLLESNKMDVKVSKINVKKCFPWIHTDKYLSLEDKEGNELCLVEDLADLNKVSRDAITQYLAQSDFVISIIDVDSIEEELEIRSYKVLTSSGPCKIQTSIEDWPKVQKDGSVILTDLNGDKYCIYSVNKMNRNSQKLISDYID